MNDEEIQNARKRLALQLDISEERVGELINELFALDKRYVKEKLLTENQSDAMAYSFMVLADKLLQDKDFDSRAKLDYLRMNISKALANVIKKNLPENQYSDFVMELRDELKRMELR